MSVIGLCAMAALASCVPVHHGGAVPRDHAASAHPESTPSTRGQAFDVIGFRLMSWGYTIHRWTITAAGEVVWEKPDGDPGPLPADALPRQIEVKRFALSAADRAALAPIVVRAEKALTLSDECRNYIPDGPYGVLTWRTGDVNRELSVNGSCLAGPQAEKANVAFDANEIVARAAKSQAAVERRPAD